MLLLLAVALGALTPGIVTAWRMYRRHGWPRAILSGTVVTVVLAGLALASLIMLPPLAFVLAVLSAAAALTELDRGRVFTALLWVWAMTICMWCAGVAR